MRCHKYTCNVIITCRGYSFVNLILWLPIVSTLPKQTRQRVRRQCQQMPADQYGRSVAAKEFRMNPVQDFEFRSSKTDLEKIQQDTGYWLEVKQQSSNHTTYADHALSLELPKNILGQLLPSCP